MSAVGSYHEWRIPMSTETVAVLWIPKRRVTSDEWAQFAAVLDAMRPGLIADSVEVDAERAGH